jgi:glycosyltransferase involved in cell wall biosynthesis
LNRIPYPLNDGGAIGSYYFVKGYADARCEVTCLAMNTAKHHVNIEETGDAFAGVRDFIVVPVDNRIKPRAALANLLTGRSYVIERFQSDEYKNALMKLLKEQRFDVIHVDGLPPCLYIDTIRKHSSAQISYRAHNVEYKIWERASEADPNPLKRWYLKIQARRLRAFEKESLGKADLVLAISREDDAYIHALQPKVNTVIVPAGMDINESNAIIQPADVSLFFIGSLDWLPNLQGLEWFLKDIWPEVHVAFPDMQFHIAGKKMPPQFYNYQALNVIAHGEVPSSGDFMNKHSVLLSPLVSGSGVRIKIIEAMAMGKVILSTTISAEGSGAIDGEHLLLADTADEFIRQIKKLKGKPSPLIQLSQNARNFAIDNFQNKNVIAKLLSHYEALCK